MLTFATALIGYTYFVLTGSEYTYEGLKRNISERRFNKLIEKTGFDEQRYKVLQRALNIKHEQLVKILEDIHHTGVVASIKGKPTTKHIDTTATTGASPKPTPQTSA